MVVHSFSFKMAEILGFIIRLRAPAGEWGLLCSLVYLVMVLNIGAVFSPPTKKGSILMGNSPIIPLLESILRFRASKIPVLVLG